jgi:CRISPR-associated protein (TIGR03984 family)
MKSSPEFIAIETITIETPKLFNTDTLKQWIEVQQEKYQLKYLLAHAEDGIIWGKFEGGKLVTAEQLWDRSPRLQPDSLQQCRIFGEKAEVMLWRREGGWQARVIRENQHNIDCLIIEKQMLWGNKIEKRDNGFTLLTDGQQGLRHAVPITGVSIDQGKPISKSSPRLVYLHIKHYIEYDHVGIAFIRYSRLFDLTTA